MPTHALQPHLTADDYLAGERKTDGRHEYVAGHVFAMGGAIRTHNIIATNLCALIRPRLRGGPCRVFMADMKVHVAAAEAFYYPDLVVTCDANDRQEFYVEHPSLIVEVLSPSTEAIDRREKRVSYQRLPSLSEFLLIEQRLQQVEIYRRTGAETWTCDTYGEGEIFRLESIGLELSVASLYEDAG